MMNFNFDYNVDMVFCIDATGSMGGLIEKVKDNALNFYQDVQRMMTNKQKTIAQLRVRVIAFRDYAADGDDAMMVTDFFNLPEEEKDFEETVRSIHAEGGGDIPEDGLEALAYAIAEATDKGAFSIAGGGDTVSAVNAFGVEDRISYISTGGGAFLEFLEGKELPGVACLLDK